MGYEAIAVRQIGAVVGLAAEARLIRKLGWHVAIGGGTAAGAEAAARRLVEAGVQALISFGLAGGLDPALRPGAITIPEAVLYDDVRYTTHAALSDLLGGLTRHVIVSVDTAIPTAQDKLRLYRQSGAAAVDIESGAVARSATSHGIPFAVLRAICDPAERALPPAALAALDANGAIAIGRVMASVVARPVQLLALLPLAIDAAAARRALKFRIKQLPTSGSAAD